MRANQPLPVLFVNNFNVDLTGRGILCLCPSYIIHVIMFTAILYIHHNLFIKLLFFHVSYPICAIMKVKCIVT